MEAAVLKLLIYMSDNAKWYVVHTYSGYENKVKANIEKSIENRNMQELIVSIHIPMEEVKETKDNKTKVTMRKIYPGYVMIKMVMDDDTWYVVRNTRGVTGFVGSGTKPLPLTEQEVESMGVERKVVELDFAVGDNVKILGGPLEGFVGVVEEINTEKSRARVIVSMFGRDTPVEVEFNQVMTIK